MAMVTDPVCGMKIDDEDAVDTAEYGGKPYYFCSQVCADAFAENPSSYVPSSG
jgi:Cu+-exporting ATPase